MMSIRSLADFNGSSLGGDSDWLTPPPSPSRAHAPGQHDERGMGTSTWPPARTSSWPPVGTFSWPRTRIQAVQRGQTPKRRTFVPAPLVGVGEVGGGCSTGVRVLRIETLDLLDCLLVGR